MSRKSINKVMTAAEAIDRFVVDEATVGIGGQTIGRCSMVLTQEIVRQRKKNLTLVGCSMSISMDMLVGAGLVTRTECGTGNVELYGATMQWRKAIEQGRLVNLDHSHLTMALRFLAGSLGLPFMPSKSLLGTDILNKKTLDINQEPFKQIDNPWNKGEPVVLLPKLNPDVSIIHAQQADKTGNFVLQGFTTHEPEMAKASNSVIVSCEELVTTDFIKQHPERTTVPYLYVDAVVPQRWGAFPTSVYGHYEHDDAHIKYYQLCAKAGGETYDRYLEENVYKCETFDDFLANVTDLESLKALSRAMKDLI